MDYPKGWGPSLQVVSSYNPKYFNYARVSANAGATGTSTSVASTASNVAFLPFTMPSPYWVRSLWWINGTTVNGNVDCGIYAATGSSTSLVRLTSTGATAQSGTSTLQSVSLGASPILLDRGAYYLAIMCTGTGHFLGTSPTSSAGTRTLPILSGTSATSLASSITVSKLPATLRYTLCGFSRLQSGY